SFFFSSRRRHTRFDCDWSSDVCSSDLKSRAQSPTVARKEEAAGTAEQRVHHGERAAKRRVPATAKRSSIFAPAPSLRALFARLRSEERRVGKECGPGLRAALVEAEREH